MGSAGEKGVRQVKGTVGGHSCEVGGWEASPVAPDGRTPKAAQSPMESVALSLGTVGLWGWVILGRGGGPGQMCIAASLASIQYLPEAYPSLL